MATLQYTITRSGWDTWSATVKLNYTVSYNAATNKSTVTFSQSSLDYWGQDGYWSDSSTTITVRAGDNTSSSGTATLTTGGNTRYEGVTYTGTPSPASITVQHSSGTGAKTISISAETSIGGYFISPSGRYTVTGSGSASLTSTTVYKLTTSATNSTITVTRSSSTLGAATGTITNNALIYIGDKLKITFTAAGGYAISTHTVNGSEFTSGGTHNVTAAVSVVSSATPVASAIASCSSSVATQSNLALTMTRYNSSYYHKATFKIGSTTLATSDAFATSLSYTVPRSWFNSYTTVTSLTVTVSVQTYTSSACTTTVGSPVTRTFTATADSGMKPTINSGFATAAAYNTGTAAASISGYVQGYSKALLTLTKSKLTMANNATVTSYKVVCQSFTQTISSPGATATVTTDTLTGTSAIKITVTVTDSRGRTASTTLSVTPMAYANPTLSAVSVFRCGSGGTAQDDGTSFSAKATAGCSSLNSQNSVTLKCWYKTVSASSYTGPYTLTSGTARVLGELSADVSYIVLLRAEDNLGNTASTSVTIPTVAWAMKFRPGGQGVGFGMAPQHSKALEIPHDWEMYFGTETFQRRVQRLYDTRGVAIPENADLDNYYNFGSYYCPDGTTAATLSNSPIKASNFRLEVFSSGASATTNCIQFMWSSHVNAIYFRRCAGGTWVAWQRLLSTPSFTFTMSGFVNASIASNAVTTTHVDFTEAFPNAAAQVVACLGGSYSSTAQAFMANLSVSVVNITTSGFDLLVGYNGSTTLTTAGIRWIASGN